MLRLLMFCPTLYLLAGLIVIASPALGAGQLDTPPAIHLPYGARVETELNFSDSDVLGLIRELLPAANELIATVAAAGGAIPLGNVSMGQTPEEALSKLDFRPLAEVLEKVTNLRVLVARYKADLPGEEVLAHFNSGAAKAGGFTRIVTDLSLGRGVFAAYSQAEGAGYLMCNYDPTKGKIYAVRLSGSIDFVKLAKWLTETAKYFIAVPSRPAEPKETTPETSPEPTAGDGN